MTAESGNIHVYLAELRQKTRNQARPTPAPPASHADLRAVPPDADLVEQFAQAAADTGAHVHRITAADWIAAVGEILRSRGAREVLAQPELRTAFTPRRLGEIRAALGGAGLRFVTATDDETIFRVAASLTGVHGAIAETGTILWESGELSARGATLIPPMHVALVRASQIVPDVIDAFDRLGELSAPLKESVAQPGEATGGAELPANLNFITGPSKTADIEGVLVTGVHGPGHVHLVLIEDE